MDLFPEQNSYLSPLLTMSVPLLPSQEEEEGLCLALFDCGKISISCSTCWQEQVILPELVLHDFGDVLHGEEKPIPEDFHTDSVSTSFPKSTPTTAITSE